MPASLAKKSVSNTAMKRLVGQGSVGSDSLTKSEVREFGASFCFQGKLDGFNVVDFSVSLSAAQPFFFPGNYACRKIIDR